jgi:hypothetical protein
MDAGEADRGGRRVRLPNGWVGVVTADLGDQLEVRIGEDDFLVDAGDVEDLESGSEPEPADADLIEPEPFEGPWPEAFEPIDFPDEPPAPRERPETPAFDAGKWRFCGGWGFLAGAAHPSGAAFVTICSCPHGAEGARNFTRWGSQPRPGTTIYRGEENETHYLRRHGGGIVSAHPHRVSAGARPRSA